MNRFPLWKNLLVVFSVIFGAIYALPNWFGEDFAVQVSGIDGRLLDDPVAARVLQGLSAEHIQPKQIDKTPEGLLIRVKDADDQLRVKSILSTVLGQNYVIALNLAPSIPGWLAGLGAEPMKLGLDLRGGVHFLMQVDVPAAVSRYLESDLEEMRKQLREARIRYRAASLRGGEIALRFLTEAQTQEAKGFLSKKFPQFVYEWEQSQEAFVLHARYGEIELTRIRDYAMEQSIATLRKRVNELGVAEAVVQRQGASRIAVELPGIQDTARAKDIIGKTATIEFRLAYPGRHEGPGSPVGYVALRERGTGREVMVKQQTIITGESIIGAYSDVDQNTGRPSVNITLGGNTGPIRRFTQTTMENIGKPMASVYVETRFKTADPSPTQEQGRVPETIQETTKEVISVATIQSVLGKSFQITGIGSAQEAKTLALLLRAGALPAPIHIISERTIGPSLGKENIEKGIQSVQWGLGLVLLAMALYYGMFGIIADLALVMNLLLLVAVCSLIHVTMTLPGIAGIVLTLGMAVDANVLIYERIREELRHGMPVQASIKAGYEKAFATIVDSNVTTLIAALVLFSIGSGPVKGFAVTLSLGLLTSMFTAVMGSRAIVNLCFGGRRLDKLPIGM
jgi:preprotein translocase subunit SecD